MFEKLFEIENWLKILSGANEKVPVPRCEAQFA